MRIVCSTAGLVGRGGSETYLITVADHLQRLGHDVWLHALETGEVAQDARALGLRVTTDLADVGTPDVALVQDGAVSLTIAAALPGVPQVFVAHSDVFDLQLPPQLPGVVSAVVTLYERVDERIRAMALQHPVTRLTQPVDTERFKPVRALPATPRVAVALGNYVHTDRLDRLRAACADAGIELRHVGSYGTEGARPAQQVLAEADIVFGKARVIVEAMACGCAAYVYDHNGAEGWVTPERYPVLAADNFGGRSEPVGVERLAADLTRYDAAMGLANRDLVVAHHAATRHVAALVPVLRAASPGATHAGAPLDELARLVRLYHRADAQAFAVQGQHAVAEAARRVAEHERDVAAAQAAEAQRRNGELERELQEACEEADRARRAFDALRGTRRWRTLQSVLAPVDAVRRRATAPSGTPATAPAPAPAPVEARPPVPMIVGMGRSGTTLLRLLLDAHPDLAIPPETGWGLVLGRPGATDGPDRFLAELCSIPTWPDLRLDRAAMQARLQALSPWDPGEALRELYRAYAERHGKPRWGDKTPMHLLCMPAIAAAIPEARFIHLIRDGRDVAVSFRAHPAAPGDGTVAATAQAWQENIEVARAAAPALAHYRELRYERLVREPEAVLRELCAWLELPWDDALLRAHERAEARLREAVNDNWNHHERTAGPPDPGRIGRWRSDLEPGDVAAFEGIAADMLTTLGYA